MKVKRLTFLAAVLLGVLFLSSCDEKNSNSNIDVQNGDNSSVTENNNTNNENDFNEDEKYQIYLMALNSGYSGTYEEWLASISGDEVVLKVSNNNIVWRYSKEADSSLRVLISLEDLRGNNGKSAFEIFLKYYPDYDKTEEEWINDLLSGNLHHDEICTVKYFVDGEVYDTKEVKKGEKAIKPLTPTKNGYDFVGWYIDNELWSFIGYTVTEDINLVAKFIKKDIIISFESEVEIDSISPISLKYLDNYTLPIPSKNGYNFLGWYLNNDLIPNTGTWNYSSLDVTLSAKWEMEELFVFTLNDNHTAYTISTNPYVPCDDQVVIPSSYNGLPVTAIANEAFKNKTDLESIVIPSTITNIGASAFDYCTNLKEISIPSGITEIPNYFCRNCINLKNVIIPNTVTKIGKGAFNTCISLKNIDLPNNITELGDSAFRSCYGLTSLLLPSSLEIIGNSAFYACHRLVEIYNLSSMQFHVGEYDSTGLGTYVKAIHTSLNDESILEKNNDFVFAYFDDTYWLMDYDGNNTKVVLPDSFNYKNSTISNYSVYKYSLVSSNITELTISKGVQEFVVSAFQNNHSNIEKIVVDSNNTKYDSRDNCNAIIEKDTNKLILGCSNTVIPNTVTSIGSSAFAYCHFDSIIIPNSVVEIIHTAFINAIIDNPNEYNGGYYLGNDTNQYLYLFDENLNYTQVLTSSLVINDNCKIISCNFNYIMSVIIPKDVIYIGRINRILGSVEYKGTTDEWNSISKFSSWNAGNSVQVVCTDGIVNVPGSN